ncbi:MAG: PHP domain-containing protein [Gammaproteobacteria bacterium]|nr:PHP domain-containing protein [Gammaproteobacteria bacterium]
MHFKYDLHSHSTASDGTLSPHELVVAAKEAGVDVLALTDHDTLDGLVEGHRAASAMGIHLVNGVEVSVTWQSQVVHLVGLQVDLDSEGLNSGLQRNREFRQWRAQEIGRRLEKSGVPGAYEAAKALSNGKLISRTHFARFLVEKGFCPDMKKVFKQYLTHGKPGHVKGEWADLEDAVGWIRQANGVAVIAHPARYGMTRTKLRRLIGEFSEAGGAALEVVTSSHSRDEIFTIARHAKDFSLKGSCGSDFHGFGTPWAVLGRYPEMPAGIPPVWQDWTFNNLAESA